jgi:predicted small lipoprotein YifL
MRRAARLSFALTAALSAFAPLAGCGQRGPLTLSESQRPIQRLDKDAATSPEPPPPPTGAPGAGAPTEPPPGGAPGATPRPEDDERPKR